MIPNIPLALTWETLSRGRWYLPAGALLANAASMLILTLLHHGGGIDRDDQALIIMHIVLTQFNAFVFGTAVFLAQGRPERLFAWPVPNARLVAWHLLPAMALVFVEMVASTALLNLAFDVAWPIWGPALFGAVLLASVDVVLWLTQRNAWLIAGLTLASGLLGFWFKSRHGPMFGQPTHYWHYLTPGEVATLLLATVVIYFVGVGAIARSRRGDSPWSLGILAWIERLLAAPAVGQALRGPAAAQFSFEWRRKGWLMPAIVVLAMLVGLTVWFISVRDPRELLGGLLGIGMLLLWMGIPGGLIIGKTGHDERHFAMGQFVATRPMTSGDIARVLLKTAIGSALVAWCIWATAAGLLYGLLTAIGVSPHPALDGLGWWYLPVTLLGMWIVTSAFATICLTGRLMRFVMLACFLAAGAIGLAIYAQWMLSYQAQAKLWQSLLGCFAIACVLGTAWAMLSAWRRGLIGATTVQVSAAAWTVMGAGILAAQAMHPHHAWPAYLFLAGLAALVVAPFAAMPLAVSWNRVR
jgi:hypothetical protein